ncbi:MAG: tripartite tricarboxylate transporter substrate binding protein [Burkholderiaceae bacterium]|nr:tripartite tricarboxylate transporter substrate binding protein [Burkholderiaceae bacterium]
MKMLLRSWVAALTLCAAGAACAQSFPAKPLHIVLGFPPGGAIDTIARVIAPKMSADLGQSVVVENKPGAGGVIGMQSVARAEPDGYTVFMGTMGNFSITPALVRDLPYDVARDFAPVTEVASSAFVLFVNNDLPVRTVAELIAYAKARPGEVNFSSSGNGGLPHMAGEMFNAAAGVKMTHVPYKGSAPSISDVVAGQVQLTFEAVAAGLSHVKAGRLRALATTGDQRLSVLPDVPTVAKTIPGFVVTNWFGMAVPAGTPADRINRIQQSVAKAMRDPDVLRTFAGLGVDPVGDSPAQFGAYIAQERQRWQKVITDARITM